MSTKNAERDVFVKKLYFGIFDSFGVAETIEVKRRIVENLFTLVNFEGNTATFKLAEELGGTVFNLTANWQNVCDEDGCSLELLWDKFPLDIKQKFADFVQKTIPGGHFANSLPSAEYLKKAVDTTRTPAPYALDHAGNKISIAGHVFSVQGYFYAIVINFGFKMLYRLLFDRGTFTVHNVAGDALGGTAVVSAGFATHFLLASAFAAPPVSITIATVAAVSYFTGCAFKEWWGPEDRRY